MSDFIDLFHDSTCALSVMWWGRFTLCSKPALAKERLKVLARNSTPRSLCIIVPGGSCRWHTATASARRISPADFSLPSDQPSRHLSRTSRVAGRLGLADHHVCQHGGTFSLVGVQNLFSGAFTPPVWGWKQVSAEQITDICPQIYPHALRASGVSDGTPWHTSGIKKPAITRVYVIPWDVMVLPETTPWYR